MEDDVLLTRGRYQPFGHHHAAVFDYFMDKHGADELNVVTEGLSNDRMPTSPFYGDEVAEMIDSSFENDYDVGYDVNVVNQESFFDDEVFGILEGEPTYFTREKSHSRVFKGLKSIYGAAFWNDVGIGGVDYEPREDRRPFERFDRPVESSSTNIRGMIDDGDDGWRRYVSDSVEDLVDENDEAREVIGRPQSSGKYVAIAVSSLF